MSETSDRYRNVAAQFTERVKAVPDGAWASPAPCEGWVARDVVRHLTEWLPGYFFDRGTSSARPAPSVDDDPLGAWLAVDGTIQAALDDPAVADSERDTRMGPSTFAQQVDMICTPDVLIHTWDLARAAGLDETLDPDEVARNVAGVEGMEPEVDRRSATAATTAPASRCPPTPTRRPGSWPSWAAARKSVRAYVTAALVAVAPRSGLARRPAHLRPRSGLGERSALVEGDLAEDGWLDRFTPHTTIR